jgi:hypothetical protein
MASENSYAQLIDDFENGIMVLEDETLSEYIKRMGGVDYNSKADGGLMIAIENFNRGGMAGGKTYHQYHDQFVPPDSESMMYANGGGVGSMMQPKKKSYKDEKLTAAEKKKIKPANQGGGPNYLGKQETVTVPKKWLSDPDHVVAELAYITPREQKILLDENLYGSLKGKPNKGPGGIMSLQGDLGGFSAGPSGGGSPGQGGGGGNNYKSRDYYKMMTGTGTTATSPTGDTVRSKNIAKGAVPEYVTVNPFTSDQRTKYVGSKYKSYGQPNFFANLFSKTPGYRGTYGTGTGFFDRFKKNKGDTIVFDEATGQYISNDPRVGDVKPGIGGRVLGGLASLFTGIPFIGSTIGSAIDKYKPKSYFDKMDPAELRRLNSLSITPFNEQKITVPDSVLNRSMVVNSPFSTNTTNQKPKANVDINNDIQTYMENDAGMYEAPPTGIMKAGGYPGNYGVVPFNPGMGASPTGIQYPGGEPNVIQDYIEQDAGMYSGLPNQKLVNEAAMEVFTKGFRNANNNYGMPQGSPGMINPEPITSMMPDPTNDLFAFNPGSKRDRTLKMLDNQVQDGLFMNDANKLQYEQLLKEDLESGEPLSLPKNRYIT